MSLMILTEDSRILGWLVEVLQENLDPVLNNCVDIGSVADNNCG